MFFLKDEQNFGIHVKNIYLCNVLFHFQNIKIHIHLSPPASSFRKWPCFGPTSLMIIYAIPFFINSTLFVATIQFFNYDRNCYHNIFADEYWVHITSIAWCQVGHFFLVCGYYFLIIALCSSTWKWGWKYTPIIHLGLASFSSSNSVCLFINSHTERVDLMKSRINLVLMILVLGYNIPSSLMINQFF